MTQYTEYQNLTDDELLSHVYSAIEIDAITLELAIRFEELKDNTDDDVSEVADLERMLEDLQSENDGLRQDLQCAEETVAQLRED